MSSSNELSRGDAPLDLQRPTHVRHLVVAVSTLMAVLLYLDRFCIGFASDYIRDDLRLTESQMDWFKSVFFLSYALAQVPSGWLSDRFGSRPMLVIYILGWSVFTAFTGLAQGFVMAVTMRLLIGLFQAGAYPSSASLLSRWVPISARAVASSVVSFGGRLGGALAPPLTALLIIAMVPASTPLPFTSGEILQPDAVAARLMKAATADATMAKPPGGAPAVRVWSLLDASQRAEVAAIAARSNDGATDADRAALAAVLNGVMKRPEFFREQDFAASNPGDEIKSAIATLKKEGSLSPERQERFHRLLLEAAFPREVMALYVRGWRPVMYVYGGAGILVAAIFWLYFRDRPAEHPGCNRAEQLLITGGVEEPPAAARPKMPIRAVLKSPGMWVLNIAQIGTNVGWLFIALYLPQYLYEVHHVPILQRGVMAMIPMVVGMAGLLVGGGFTDWLSSRVGLRWGRVIPLSATRFLAASGYGLVLLLTLLPSGSPLNSPWVYVAALSLVSLGVDAGLGAVWALYQDVSGKHVGSVLGWGNMWGNLGAFFAPHLYRMVLGSAPKAADWNAMFVVCAGAFVVSGACLFLVDTTKPLAEEPAA